MQKAPTLSIAAAFSPVIFVVAVITAEEIVMGKAFEKILEAPKRARPWYE